MSQSSKRIIGEMIVPDRLFHDLTVDIDSVISLKSLLSDSSKRDVSQILEIIMGSGIILEASDIHFEPEEEDVNLRIRLDGILQEIGKFDHKTYKSVLSRIKLLSSVKLNITSVSQDGRFSVKYPLISTDQKGKPFVDETDEYIEVRSSFLPSEYGETTVLRILNPKKLVEIEKLGLRKDLKDLFDEEIKRPNGMIIVTGPTGSGKTTTLYAVLKKLQSPEIKIITIEDPIEYHLEGISQTRTRPDKGYDFANGLRAIVRQDPDVILVGEVRDLETAEIALQAALTGHLVLTTLHTNDAAGAVARLQSLGEKPYNIAPAVNIVIAQRLVRRVCSECSVLEKISEEDYQKIKKGLEGISEEIVKFSKESKIAKAVGCDKCNNTGYKGRLGIFEILRVDSEMEKLILSGPSSSEIEDKAILDGMLTVYQDGLIKVLTNQTTINEVERVAFQK